MESLLTEGVIGSYQMAAKQVADILKFHPKASSRRDAIRDALIAKARANYESIFPTAPHCDLTIGRVEQEDNRPSELA